LVEIDLVAGLGLWALGLVAAAFGVLVGSGGGFIVGPLLILIFQMEHTTAVGTSLVAVFLASVSGSATLFRLRRIDLRSGVLFAVAAVPGVLLGVVSVLVLVLPVHHYKPLLACTRHIGHPLSVRAENETAYFGVLVLALPVHHYNPLLACTRHIGHPLSVRAENQRPLFYPVVLLLLLPVRNHELLFVRTGHIGHPPTVRTDDDGFPYHRGVTLVY